MVMRDGPIIRAKFPRPGTPWGDQKRDEFIAGVKAACAPYPILFFPLPKIGDTTTVTDESKNGATVTASESLRSFDTTPGAQGSGVRVYFNGTDEELDAPDIAGYSFGDSVNDSPFSIVAWPNQTANAAAKTILSKQDTTSGSTKREWLFYFSSTEKLTLLLADESVGNTIGQVADAVQPIGTDIFVAATYDGSGAEAGIKLYVNAAVEASTANGSGAYTAMENTASLIRVGFNQGAAAGQGYFPGSMNGLPILVGGALSVDQLEVLGDLGNAYYDLAL